MAALSADMVASNTMTNDGAVLELLKEISARLAEQNERLARLENGSGPALIQQNWQFTNAQASLVPDTGLAKDDSIIQSGSGERTTYARVEDVKVPEIFSNKSTTPLALVQPGYEPDMLHDQTSIDPIGLWSSVTLPIGEESETSNVYPQILHMPDIISHFPPHRTRRRSSIKPDEDLGHGKTIAYSALSGFVSLADQVERPNDVSRYQKELEAFPAQLGCFRHVPADGRLKLAWNSEVDFPVPMLKSLLQRSIEFIWSFDQKYVEPSISIYDSNFQHGIHRYMFNSRDVYGDMPKIPWPKPPGHSTAPWSRLILCEGLSEWAFSQRENEEDYDVCPVFAKGGPVHAAMTLHLECGRLKEGDHYRVRETIFHVIGYSVFGNSDSDTKLNARDLWKCGPLYDGGQDSRWLAQRSYTILAIPDAGFLEDGDPGSSQRLIPHYTIVLLTPSGFHSRCTLPQWQSSMQAHMLSLIFYIFLDIKKEWQTILDHMEQILDDGDMLLSPDKHDNLLFDDETFSRSRRYFWAITALETFEANLQETIAQWKDYRRTCIDPLAEDCRRYPDKVRRMGPYTNDNPQGLDLDKYLANIEAVLDRLNATEQRFRIMRTRTQALRAALFSASGVIESRAATQLGENVRLLTYVSIFYLPLAFCTSLWSINEVFGTNKLVYVTVIVAFATYLVVFNLNSIVKTGRRGYDSYKRKTLRHMKHDYVSSWKTTAKDFERFQPKRDRMAPTAWWLPVYSIIWLAGKMGLRRAAAHHEGETRRNQGEKEKRIPVQKREAAKSGLKSFCQSLKYRLRSLFEERRTEYTDEEIKATDVP